MAVSKRIRYEVLRRDNFACRYCGAKAPEANLTVDHVTPVALGGSDDPTNLVAACRDCNAGKSSSTPDAETVADVASDALRWRRAMEEAARRAREKSADEQDVLDAFFLKWTDYYIPLVDGPPPLAANWEQTVLNYWRAGLPSEEIVDAVRIAIERRGVAVEGRFPYFCGVARKKLETLAQVAADMIEGGEV